MKSLLTSLFITFSCAIFTNAQNMGIGTATPASSARLEISSTNSGLLIPRVALTGTNVAGPITAPATSLLVYNTATVTNVTPGFYFWDGTAWVRFVTGTITSDWTLSGNAGTSASLNFIGTVDNVDFVIRTNNTEAMRVTNGQRVGIGTNAPVASAKVEITSTNSGLLIPRVALTATNAAGPITAPATSLLVYNTATAGTSPNNVTPGYYYWDGTAWTRFATGTIAAGWNLTGNAGTSAATNYIGTSDNTDLVIRTNATEAIRVNNAQRVGIGTNAPVASAKVEITSTNSGLLIPRVALTATNAAGPIAAPATSLLVYNTATAGTSPNDVTPGYYYWDGSAWTRFVTGIQPTGWLTTGNAAVATDFVGTTNAVALRFHCNNTERMRINAVDGEIVAGATASPYAGDLLNAVGTAASPFALNGYSAVNGAATWGEVLPASATAFSAVQGVYTGSGSGAGALGNYNGTNTSSTRAGVVGIVTTPTTAAGGTGVYGYSSMATGSARMGVLGAYNGGAFGTGVTGLGLGGAAISSNTHVGVAGMRANNSDYSGYFNGNHVIANGTKSASVGTSQGNQLLYCMESPEVWFEDFGTGALVNGEAEVKLDPLFLETVLIDEKHPIHVFVQVEGQCNGVFVETSTTSFKVKELNNGKSSTRFSYRLVAKRWSFPDHRFGNDPVWGEGDTRKYMKQSPKRSTDYHEKLKQNELEDKKWKEELLPPTMFYPGEPQFATQRDPKDKVKVD